MRDEFNMDLSARERGYRQPGTKLKPRCGYDAAEMRLYKSHSMRELRKAREIESKAMTEWYVKHEGFDPSIATHWRRHYRAMDALSARRRKVVDRALNAVLNHGVGERSFPGCRAMQRAYDSAIAAEGIERCMQHDDMMLRNCY